MGSATTTTDSDEVVRTERASHSSSTLAHAPPRRRRAIRLVGVSAVIAAVGFVFAALRFPNAAPEPQHNTSIDAFVDGHVTSVSARATGHVLRVLVDENKLVTKGDVLIELDKEPFEVQVGAKRAAVTAAEADLAVAQAQVRALVAQVRANRYKLAQAIEDVNSQIADLRANVSALDSKKATLELAQANLRRGEQLADGVLSKEEITKRRQAVEVAAAAFEEALHEVNASRASLGLSRLNAQSSDLGAVPADHDQTDSSVRQSLLELLQSLALLGYSPSSWKLAPQQIIDEFYKQD